jgi:Popeye protein conserved region
VNNPVVWITVANVIYLISYSVRDILVLRILTVAGASLLIPYYAMQTVPLKAAIGWSLVFIAINIYWIIKLLIERRPVHLTPDEARLRVLSFPSLTAREARDLYATGIWDDVVAGASLVGHDRDGGRFSVILRGIGDVIYRKEKISELGEGQFVGNIDLRADESGDIDVLMKTAARVMCWPRQRLQEFLSNRPDVALALQRSVGYELQQLLDQTMAKLAGDPPAATT